MDEVLILTADEQIEVYNAIKSLLVKKKKVTLISISMITNIPMAHLYEALDDVIIILERVTESLKVR